MNILTEYFEQYLVIGADKQVIYFMERPNFSFREKKTGVKKGQDAYVVSGGAKWYPISIEIPTRPLGFMQEWIEKRGKKNIVLQKVNKDGKIVEQWHLFSVEVGNIINRRSRVADLGVLNVILHYGRAMRA